jgi:hypothetical protein
MITITCTNCHTTLTMDEAFAGGVCRCQHCGTIQTVPKSAKHGVTTGAPTASKTLWKQKTASDTSAGTGLDELADIVASSGLAGSGLQSGGLRKRPASTATAAPAANKKLMPILAGAGGAIAVLLIVLIWFLIKGPNPSGSPTGTVSTPGATANETPAVTVAGPSFAKVKLDKANTVAYVLDRGSGTASVFGDLKNLTLKSVASLGSDKKFQIVFWQVRGQVYAYPESGATVAGDTSVNEATRKLNDEVNAFGSSNIGPALKKAASSNPDVIIIATGKGADLDDTFAQEVKANKPAGVKIHTFSLGGGDAPLLKSIASESGGEYHEITISELNSLR